VEKLVDGVAWVRWIGLSALGSSSDPVPKALPWAGMGRAFAAFLAIMALLATARVALLRLRVALTVRYGRR
jgi:hypothetical protein